MIIPKRVNIHDFKFQPTFHKPVGGIPSKCTLPPPVGGIPSKCTPPVYPTTLKPKRDISPQNSHSLLCIFPSLPSLPSLKDIKSDKDVFNKRDYEINRQMKLFRDKLNENKITNLKEQWDMFNHISHLFGSKQIEYVKYIKAIESIDIILKTCKTSKN